MSFEPIKEIILRWLQPMPTSRLSQGGIRLRDKRRLVCRCRAGRGESYYSHLPISRLELAAFLVYSLAVVALTWRFLVRRPAMTTLVGRLFLTSFVIAILNQLVITYSFPPLWMTLGLSGLGTAWIANRMGRPKYHGMHRHGTPSSAAVSVQTD